jgi:hypothetical protein
MTEYEVEQLIRTHIQRHEKAVGIVSGIFGVLTLGTFVIAFGILYSQIHMVG